MLVIIAFVGVEIMKANILFAIYIPYLAIGIFIAGVVYRVLRWGCSPVPFRIPTTCGQQKSLSWIIHSRLENPANGLEVIGRMALEILFFRSLFRGTYTELKKGPYLQHLEEKWLWLAGIIFHWSFFIIIVRHLRLFIEPVPNVISLITNIDGFLQIVSPTLYLSGITLLLAVSFLLLRRILIPRIRYISLSTDYFPLFLILAIAISGILMRYFIKVDVISIKTFMIQLFIFKPVTPPAINSIFYIHLLLVSVLLAYFPFSKLVHMGGVFFSPTRSMANNSRMKRHINPWDYVVKVHTYEEYEDEFREKMKKVGIPVEVEQSPRK